MRQSFQRGALGRETPATLSWSVSVDGHLGGADGGAPGAHERPRGRCALSQGDRGGAARSPRQATADRGRRRARPGRQGRAVDGRRRPLLADPPARDEARRRADDRRRQGGIPALATVGRRGAAAHRPRQEPPGGAAGGRRLQAIPLAARDRGAGRRNDGAGAGADRPRSPPGPDPPGPLPARVGDPVRPLVQGGESRGRQLGGQGEEQPPEHASPEEPGGVRPPRAGRRSPVLPRRGRGGPRRGDGIRQGSAGARGQEACARRRHAGALEEGGGRRLLELAVRARAGGLPAGAGPDRQEGRSHPLGGGLDRRGPGRAAAGRRAARAGGAATFAARRRRLPRRPQRLHARAISQGVGFGRERPWGHPGRPSEAGHRQAGKRQARQEGQRAAERGRGGPPARAGGLDARATPRGVGRHLREPESGPAGSGKAHPGRQGRRAAGTRRRHAEVDPGGADGRSLSQRVGGDRGRARGHPGIAGRARARRQE